MFRNHRRGDLIEIYSKIDPFFTSMEYRGQKLVHIPSTHVCEMPLFSSRRLLLHKFPAFDSGLGFLPLSAVIQQYLLIPMGRLEYRTSPQLV